MWEEFKSFALRGNVFDLAVAVIVGGAFGKIVDSLVRDLMMPIVGIIVGGVDFDYLVLSLGKVQIRYGAFLQTAVDFFIISTAIFLLVKIINRIRGKQKIEVKPDTQDVLVEIRDLIKKGLEEPKSIEKADHVDYIRVKIKKK